MALTAEHIKGAPKPIQMLAGEIPFDQEWQTTCCQCGGYESCCHDWCCALFLPPVAVALARSNLDGTNCCMSLFGNTPQFNFNVVRRRYGIRGDDGEDGLYATCCPICSSRQALTEVTKRGRLQDRGVYRWSLSSQDAADWMRGLCNCSPSTFCYALFCPQCLAAQARTNFDGSGCCFNFCCGTPHGIYNMIRQGYGIRGSCGMDFLLVSLFYPCALQQAYEEALFKYLQKVGEMLKKKCCSCC